MGLRCVIGIGCDDHGDQIAGLLVARLVAASAPAGVAVCESSGAPAELIAAWQGAAHAVVVEAMPGDVPGVVNRCQPHPRTIPFGSSPTRGCGRAPASRRVGTSLSPEVREALALGPLPQQVTVVTIEARCFVRHAPPSPAVAAAAGRVAAGLRAELAPPAISVPVDAHMGQPTGTVAAEPVLTGRRAG